MEKLIVNIPAFNKEAIKESMFIEVTQEGCSVKYNGIVSGVSDKKVYYRGRLGTVGSVNIDDVLEGRTIIKVDTSLQNNPVTDIIKGASTGVVKGYTRLNITLQRNPHTDGILFTDVFVDGVPYVQKFK